MEIMNAVWNGGEITVGEVWEAVSARRRVSRKTIQTLMTRLAEKGWLEHRAVGKAFLYRAAVPRSKTLGQVVERLVDTAFGGAAEGLVLALLKGRGLSEAEAARIREMIEAAEERKRGQR